MRAGVGKVVAVFHENGCGYIRPDKLAPDVSFKFNRDPNHPESTPVGCNDLDRIPAVGDNIVVNWTIFNGQLIAKKWAFLDDLVPREEMILGWDPIKAILALIER